MRRTCQRQRAQVVQLHHTEIFHKREVRHPQEKLIALSAIASMLSTKMDRVYLVGMWYDKTLKWGLSWQRASQAPAGSLVLGKCQRQCPLGKPPCGL